MSPVFRGLWVGVALMFFTVGLSFETTHAAETTPNKNFPQLLSYSEIMSLTPRKREIYINGVRKMFIELSKTSAKQKTEFFAGRENEFDGSLALLNMILPSASAADALPPEANVVPDMEKEYNNRPYCDPDKRIFAQSIKNRDRKEFWYCANDKSDNSSCPAGFLPVDQGVSGKFKCATIASFEALNSDIQKILRAPTNTKDEKLAQAFAAVPERLQPVTSCTEPLVEFEYSSAKGCIQPKPYGDTYCPTNFVGVSQKADGSFMCMSSESFNRFPEADRKKLRLVNQGEAQRGNRDVNFLNSNGKQTFEVDAGGKDEGKAQVSGDAGSQCKPVALECKKAASAEEFEKYRADFYKSNASQSCIYAGNISSYHGPKAPGRCMPPGPLALTEAQAAAKMEGDGYWSCKGKGVLCNPLLFGVKKDSNQPFCASARTVAGKGPTEQCDAMSTPEASDTEFLEWKSPGIHEQWNKFRAGFNSLCKENEASRNFHCAECGVIAKRLPEINKLAFNNCEGPTQTAPASNGGSAAPKPAPGSSSGTGPGHH